MPNNRDATYNVVQPQRVAEPQAAIYGVFAPKLADNLANPNGDGLTTLALQGAANNELQAYKQALATSNQTYLSGLDRENQQKMGSELINNLSNLTQAGVGSAVSLPDNSYLRVNPAQTRLADATYLNKTKADQVKAVAEADKAFSEAGGSLSEPFLNASLQTPGETDGKQLITLKTGPTLRDITKEDADAKAAAAAAEGVKAKAAMKRAELGVGDTQTTVYNGFGLPPTVTDKHHLAPGEQPNVPAQQGNAVVPAQPAPGQKEAPPPKGTPAPIGGPKADAMPNGSVAATAAGHEVQKIGGKWIYTGRS